MKISIRWALIVTVPICLILVVLIFLPSYLNYADKPVKSDVIVLLVGDDWVARQREAEKLLADGYAKYIIIPAYNRLICLGDNGIMSPIEFNYLTGNSAFLLREKFNYPQCYENTHFELLEALRIMKKLDLISAIIVSSPYHMRRIKFICETVFNNTNINVSYIPTRYEQNPINVFDRIFYIIKWCYDELLKIIWFKLYNIFL